VFPEDLAVAPRDLLRARGISDRRIRSALRSGRWQEPVRGIVVPHSGALTQRERWQVALAFAGPDSCLSHHSALALWGAKAQELRVARRVAGVQGDYVPLAEGGMVEVSRVHGQHMSSHGFVVVHQSRRALEPVELCGLRATRVARAATDVAITATRRRDVDHVIADVLQRGLCAVRDLEEEAARLGRYLTPWLRQALDDAKRGMRSVGEADLRRALELAGVPEPEWNAAIETPSGTYFVDAYWRKRRVAVEADGAEFHLSAGDWQADLRRQNAIQGVDVRLYRYPVRRLRAEPFACGCEIGRYVA
jgi:hypothetical protein